MKRFKKIAVGAVLLSFVGLFAAFAPLQPEPAPQNLKVLSKDLTIPEVKEIMKGFNAALGVDCEFCHAKSNTDPARLDFASDENGHKDVARRMLRMVAKINKQYFKNHMKEGKVAAVSCATCHNGQKRPRSI